MVVDSVDMQETVMGLGYGDVEFKVKEEKRPSQREEASTEGVELEKARAADKSSTEVAPIRREVSPDDEEEVSFPDQEALRSMQTRLRQMDVEKERGEGDAWGQRDELVGMVGCSCRVVSFSRLMIRADAKPFDPCSSTVAFLAKTA